jgi:hypothetical protein
MEMEGARGSVLHAPLDRFRNLRCARVMLMILAQFPDMLGDQTLLDVLNLGLIQCPLLSIYSRRLLIGSAA